MLTFEQHQYSATTLGSDNTTSITSPQISKTSKNYIAIAETKFMTRPNQFLKNKYVVETTMLKNAKTQFRLDVEKCKSDRSTNYF